MYRTFRAALLCGTIILAGCTLRLGDSFAEAVGKGVTDHIDPVRQIRQVADRVLTDFPEPPPFDWGEGVLMAGMIQAGLATDEPRYVAFVQRWADHWRDKGLAPILAGAPQGEERGYCGHWGPGFPVVMLYEETKDPSYLATARQIAEFIETKATRTPDGGLGHWAGNYQLWADTLYMVCPLMASLGRIESRPAYTREAVRQLEIFTRHCRDNKTGLFYHMYDQPTAKRVGVLWGRGNGWVVMSYVEVLRNLDRTSPEFARLSADFQRLVRALLAVQDKDTGLWHTVLDRPDSYIETSASAMILYGFAEGTRLGLVDGVDREEAAAWFGLCSKANDGGHVIDVSGGTSPAAYEAYANKVRGTESWGTGAFLLAASAVKTQWASGRTRTNRAR
ncbi:MAG: glycoside hydrolase family 88/105 protein [Phycisphaerae bacterium]